MSARKRRDDADDLLTPAILDIIKAAPSLSAEETAALDCAVRGYRPLTAEETAVVAKYAREHGRRWKADLREAWANASEPGILQALRNTLGPNWLVSYRLPVEPDR